MKPVDENQPRPRAQGPTAPLAPTVPPPMTAPMPPPVPTSPDTTLPPAPLPYPPVPLPSTPLSIPGTTALPSSASSVALRTPAYARTRLPQSAPPPMNFAAGTPSLGGMGSMPMGDMSAPSMNGEGGGAAGGFSGDSEGFSGSNDNDLVKYIVENLVSRGGGGR